MSDDIKKHLESISEKQDKLSDKVAEIKEEVAEHSALFRQHLEQDEKMYETVFEMEKALVRNTTQLEFYNRQLEIHIAGVNELREANDLTRQLIARNKEQVEAKLRELEFPWKVTTAIKKVFIWVSAVATGSIAVWKILEMIVDR